MPIWLDIIIIASVGDLLLFSWSVGTDGATKIHKHNVTNRLDVMPTEWY